MRKDVCDTHHFEPQSVIQKGWGLNYHYCRFLRSDVFIKSKNRTPPN